jgi:YHS domain-containing protein
MFNISYKITALTLMLGLGVNFTGLANAGEINTGYFGNVAIKGYDPVAYFTEQQAVKGNDDISHDWLGAQWIFSSEKHKALFSQNPVKYAPQYGGHCADGVAYGVVSTYIDPQAWRIIEGKFYLNCDQESAVELEETEGVLEKSVENWPALREELLENSD